MSKLTAISYDYSVVLIDGQCLLCHGFAKRILNSDKKNRFKLGYLQTFVNDDLVKTIKPQSHVDSVILIKNGKPYIKSEAALRVMKSLGGLYRISMVFRLIPKFIRDIVYDWIARNRFGWYKKLDECPIPPQKWRDKFI